MKTGLFISLILHGGILAWALVSLQSTKAPEIKKPTPIVVDITSIADLTRAKKGAPKPKPKKVVTKKPPVKAKPKPKAKPAPQKTAALPPAKSEPPKPDPIKEILKKPPPEKLKPSIKPKPKPKPVVKKKPKPKPKKVVKKKTTKKIKRKAKKDFDAESIAALLNKIPDAKAGPKPKRVTKKKKVAAVEADQGALDGADKTLTISEFDFFIRQIGNCFAIPAGAKDAEDFRPVVAFSLNKDGSVDGIPRVVNNVNSPFFRIAAESSIRAILECQPYALPKKKYNDWKKNKITFDLKAMIGG